MTITRKLTSLSVAAAVAAGTLIPLATSADAGRRHHRDHYSYRHYDDGYSHRYAGPHHERYVYRKKRRNHVGPAIALGVGALMLGIIASEHRRKHRHRHYYD